MAKDLYLGTADGRVGDTVIDLFVWSKKDKETKALYNVFDKTGDHPVHPPHDEHYTALPRAVQVEIQRLYDVAKTDGQAQYEYRKKRRRDTNIESLEYAWLVEETLTGHLIHMDDELHAQSHRLIGYGLTAEQRAEIDRLQIPYINQRTMTGANAVATNIAGPVLEAKPGHATLRIRYNALDEAPLEVYAALFAAMGATIKHIKYDINDAARCQAYRPEKAPAAKKKRSQKTTPDGLFGEMDQFAKAG